MSEVHLTEDQFQTLTKSAAEIDKVLGSAVLREPPVPEAVVMRMEVDSQNDEFVTYEVELQHGIVSLELIGLQMFWVTRDLLIVEKVVLTSGPFPAILTVEPKGVPSIGLGSQPGGVGTRPGTYNVMHVRCKKTGPAPLLDWDRAHSPPSRFTTRQSVAPAVAWLSPK